jgi:hypothetical protein
MVKNYQPEQGLLVAVYHADAQYNLRRLLIDFARKHFKELEKAEVNALLSHSAQRQRMLDERFEEMFLKT